MAKKMRLKKVFETDSISELIEIKKNLSNMNIRFEIQTKTSTILRNFLNLFLYQVLTSGIDRQNEVMCIYVEEKDFNHAKQIIQDIKVSIL